MHPINANSEAMQDGRSSRPGLPAEFRWIVLTRNINALLGTNYTIEQIEQMPSDKLNLLRMWIEANAER